MPDTAARTTLRYRRGFFMVFSHVFSCDGMSLGPRPGRRPGRRLRPVAVDEREGCRGTGTRGVRSR
jgi:hypothetical protein